MKKFLGYFVLILGAISMLLPFIYMFSLSLMTDKQIFSGGVSFLPSPFTLDNYQYVISNVDIFKYFFLCMLILFKNFPEFIIILIITSFTMSACSIFVTIKKILSDAIKYILKF